MTTLSLDSLRFNYFLALDCFFAAAKAHAVSDRFEVDPIRQERLALERAQAAFNAALAARAAAK